MARGLAVAIGATVFMACLAPAAGAQSEWNLAKDFRFSPDQENPSRDRLGNAAVWHYLEGPVAATRDPSTYARLTNFDDTSSATNQHWQSASTGNPLFVGAQTTEQMGVMHPDPSFHSIAGWRSPLTGTVDIHGSFRHGDSGGNGITWFIDKGATNLMSGEFGDSFSQNGISVASGDFLYFIVSANGDSNFDSTLADITIDGTPVGGSGGAPVLSNLTVAPKKFRAASKGKSVAAKIKVGAKIGYTLSEDAKVTFRVKRRKNGKLVKGKFKHAGEAGENSFRFTGRVKGHKLKPGRYLLIAKAKDADGEKSKAKRAKFKIVG